MFTREQMKQAAKMSIKKDWGNAVIAVLLSILPSTVISVISQVFSLYQSGGVASYFSAYSGDYTAPEPSLFSIILSLISLLVGIFITPVLTVGVFRFFLKLRGNLQPNGTEAISPFKEGTSGNIIAVNFIVGLNLLFWYILFIIPGIIKSFQYALVQPILASNPQLSSSRVKAISKKMMEGYCGEYFILLLSFFGWFIIALFTGGVLSILYVQPYFKATVIEFYSCRRAELILRGELSPAELPSFGTDWYSPYNNNGPFASSGYNGGFNQSGFNQGGFNQGFSSPAGMPFTGNNQGIAQGYGTPLQNQPPVRNTAPVHSDNRDGLRISNNTDSTPLQMPSENKPIRSPQSEPLGDEPFAKDTLSDEDNNTEI